MHLLSPDDARRVLMPAEGDPLEPLYRLAITAGLRLSMVDKAWTRLKERAGVPGVRVHDSATRRPRCCSAVGCTRRS